jgi:hypothetical protein
MRAIVWVDDYRRLGVRAAVNAQGHSRWAPGRGAVMADLKADGPAEVNGAAVKFALAALEAKRRAANERERAHFANLGRSITSSSCSGTANAISHIREAVPAFGWSAITANSAA